MKKVIVDSKKRNISLNLKELAAYYDLFLTLTYRDLRVKYAQTFMGFTWAFVQPLVQLIILTFVFGKVVNVDTGNIPHPLFTRAGMCSWTYFALVVQQSGSSIIGAQYMVKKIYFPRLIIPLSKAIIGFIDYGITLVFLIVLLVYYDFIPSANILYLPIFILLTIMAGLGAGIWISALTIRYRDFQYVIPFVLQFGLYATPIAYPVELVPEKFLLLFHLNPMSGIVEGFRWSVVGGNPPETYAFLSFGVSILLFLTGIRYFKKAEQTIADII